MYNLSMDGEQKKFPPPVWWQSFESEKRNGEFLFKIGEKFGKGDF